MVVVEEGFAPLPSQREGLLLEPCKRILEDMGKGLHLGELRQLILTQGLLC